MRPRPLPGARDAQASVRGTRGRPLRRDRRGGARRDPAGPAGAATGGFDFSKAQVAVTGLLTPWGMAFLPDRSALVTERATATIWRVSPGYTPARVTTIRNVYTTGDGGLLGIALSPTFTQDQLVYVYYTGASDNRVVRFRWGYPDAQQVVLAGIPRGLSRNGGRIAFGPDGMLYVSTGDAGNPGNAQNPGTLGGKILRVRPDGTVPPDNPFAGSPVYSYGHRNVQGLAWDPGGLLYATEFGEDAWDELNAVVPGGNYGWPACQGVCGDTRWRDPIATWRPAEASPSGLAYANGTLFAAALRGTRLWAVPAAGGTAGAPVAELPGRFGRLRTVALGPDGWLWVTTSNHDSGGTPVFGDDRIIRIPPVDGSWPPGGSSPSPSAGPPLSPSPSPSPSPPGGSSPCPSPRSALHRRRRPARHRRSARRRHPALHRRRAPPLRPAHHHRHHQVPRRRRAPHRRRARRLRPAPRRAPPPRRALHHRRHPAPHRHPVRPRHRHPARHRRRVPARAKRRSGSSSRGRRPHGAS
ncbi:hypothetical protein GCM10027612_62670 [Microbispora bryophytorum subsp. camponoti]